MKLPDFLTEHNGLDLSEVIIETRYYGNQDLYVIECKIPKLGPQWGQISVEAHSLNDCIRFLTESILEHYSWWLQENNN